MAAKFSIYRNATAASSASPTTIATIYPSVSATGPAPVLCEFGISFNGNSSVDYPIRVDLINHASTAAGTTSITVQKWSRSVSGSTVVAFTTQTLVSPNVLSSWYVHPQGGNLVIQYPLGREPVISDASSAYGGLAFQFLSNNTSTPNYSFYAIWEG